jgi:hypothetical protein
MSTSWETYERPGTTGGGWEYNNANIAYAGSTNPDTGHTLYYGGEGTPQTWSNQTKS